MRDRPVDQRDLAVEEIDLAQRAVQGLTFLDGKLELGQPRAALLAEQITDVRAPIQPPTQRLGRRWLRVRRRGTALFVAFERVAEADRYELVTTLASGGQRVTRTRRTAVTLRSIARDSVGTVAVRAVAPMREAARTDRFRATDKTRTRFGPLG